MNGAARGGSHLLCLPGDGEGGGAGAGRTGAVLPQGSEETALVPGAGQELPDTPGHSMPSAPGTTLQLAGRGRHSRPEGPGDGLWPLRVVSLRQLRISPPPSRWGCSQSDPFASGSWQPRLVGPDSSLSPRAAPSAPFVPPRTCFQERAEKGERDSSRASGDGALTSSSASACLAR